jgi:hypothetical protein
MISLTDPTRVLSSPTSLPTPRVTVPVPTGPRSLRMALMAPNGPSIRSSPTAVARTSRSRPTSPPVATSSVRRSSPSTRPTTASRQTRPAALSSTRPACRSRSPPVAAPRSLVEASTSTLVTPTPILASFSTFMLPSRRTRFPALLCGLVLMLSVVPSRSPTKRESLRRHDALFLLGGHRTAFLEE